LKKEKGKNVVIGVLLSIIILLLIVIIIIVITKKNTLTNNNTSNNNQTNTTSKVEENNNDTNPDTHITLTGTYINKSENENSYHSASIEITNQTDTTIDFKLEAIHGMDIDHVNIGNVSGTANKIDNNIYEFEETIDGQTSKITFEFNNNKVTITENYPNSINPYAGHNVYFAGEYNKEI